MLEARAPRLVLFSDDDPRFHARVRRRERLLAMRPVDPTESVAVPFGEATGCHWELLRPDDEVAAVRARSLPTAHDAHRDAPQVLARVSEMRAVYVRDVEAGHLSWWLALGPEAVLVAPRRWTTAQRTAVVRDAKRTLMTMAVMPSWGPYEPVGPSGEWG